MSETITKFQPDRSMYFRGFSGIDSAAAMHSATSTGFTVSGVFRDPAAFWVLVLFDIDDFYDHASFKPLPDPSLTGIVLEFDVTYTGLAPLDTPKFPTIDYPYLDFIRMDGSTGSVDISFDNTQSSLLGTSSTLLANTNPTTVTSGSHTSASTTVGVECSSAEAGDVLTLWFENYAYSYTMLGGDNPDYVATQLAAAISAESYSGNTYGLSATSSGANITITASRPGSDANMIRLYWVSTAPSRCSFNVASPIQLSGGSSAVTFHVKLDFTALGIDDVRQLWLTFAPQLADSAAYTTTTADAVFSNWEITADPNNLKALQVAGPGSVRVEESDAWCTYSGTGWAPTSTGWFSKGFANVTDNISDSVTITYWSQFTHDLWVGTSLYSDRGKFTVTVDGAAQATLDMYLADTQDVAISTRRKIANNITPGQHTVVLTAATANSSSSGNYCYFDFLEAAVPSDVPDPPGPWSDRAPAIDYDTQHGYQLAPARLMWMYDMLGFTGGPIDEYVGVFWWNQRAVTGQTLASATVTFNSGFVAGDSIFLDIGGTTIGKSVFAGETTSTWAAHFAYYINEVFSGVWAEASGAVLTITTRSAATAYQFTLSTSVTSTSGTLTVSGNLNSSVAGTWIIDPTQTPALNYAAQCWHADLFAQVYLRGNTIVSALSMELVNTPDDGSGDVWVCRFPDNSPVLTATGFGSLNSSQCVPNAPNFLAYQKAAYLQLAELQTAAGLTPLLQFGEFLWWFFARLWFQPIGYISDTDPISIGMPTAHGLSTGDHAQIAQAEGCTSANGTWPVTVTNSTHFTIPVAGNGTWVSGTGILNAGGMAYNDAYTQAAAETSLGRALTSFYLPTDDPSVNSYADANFLAGQLAAHVQAIITYVQATYPPAQFEVLMPLDVNGQTQTATSMVGGALNAYVSFPSSWQSQSDAPFQFLKIEALAFLTTDRNLDYVKTMQARVASLAWTYSAMRYLYTVDNPGVAQWPDYRLAKAAGFTRLTPWAFDQINLLNWPVEEPAELATAQLL